MSDVPADFPRDPWPVALTAAQPNSSARLIDGKFVLELTDEERLVRYERCSNLVTQNVAYGERTQVERPDEPRHILLRRVGASVRSKGWDLSPIDISWLMTRVEKRL